MINYSKNSFGKRAILEYDVVHSLDDIVAHKNNVSQAT